ncbi:carboxypeptidase-like regulatory domain-containing protein [Hymenobacter properus]|uniref:Carboxypeptidase-like regulatory domain-containing protein n=1 Tax=Hymenobacter properus TaxID=2791026 RepID=A0A931FHX9_9BACT|nr:carboxypeptidase-like regulatory domain-containing protein [Hymenobacter properus]MBF9141492.1 carboxypeptidase-like regulatory domain-containing protein [Hymenobacter properus]MBR7720301.1 carboxypeptidase-like regulatory domain-containing protein [Microvirga sp. SRT04]
MVTIPKPCAANWDNMSPTAAGRHCHSCQTEVVDFTRMSEAEVLAFLAARRGPVCAFIAAPAVPAVGFSFGRAQGPRRWLLAAMTLLSGQPVAALRLPSPLPAEVLVRQNPAQAIITIRGVVLDDSLNVPLASAPVYIDKTPYGVITNERGEFSVTLPANWEPVKAGSVTLRIARRPFALLEKTVVVSVKGEPAPAPVVIRQLSVPQRGFLKGKADAEGPPAPVPGALFSLAASRAAITIRGVVVDDSLQLPVPGAEVFIDGTKYGTVANGQGEFKLTFARDWKVLEQRQLVLRFTAGHFVFMPKYVPLDINRPPTARLEVRLLSTLGRGGIMGKIARTRPPVRPPRPHKSSS